MTNFTSLLSEIISYFDKAQLAAEDLRQHNLSLGGRQARIVYSSATLETSLFQAFEHLENTGNHAAPEFHIFACDNKILNRALPGWKQFEEISGKEAMLVTYNSETIHALYNPESHIFSLVDTAARRGWYYLPQVSDLPYYEKAAPMRMLLHWWCEMTERVLVHGAAVGWNSQAVLLAGRGGTGKSTTAMLAAQSGFDFLGDDYVVLDNAHGPSVLSAYNSVKFRWEMTDRLPETKIHAVNHSQDDDKGYFYLYQTHRDILAESLPLKAVLLPSIAQKDKTTFFRLPSTRGLLGLAASSIFQMPGSGKQTLTNLADILKDIPVYQMSLGTDNAEIVNSLKTFLHSREG